MFVDISPRCLVPVILPNLHGVVIVQKYEVGTGPVLIHCV